VPHLARGNPGFPGNAGVLGAIAAGMTMKSAMTVAVAASILGAGCSMLPLPGLGGDGGREAGRSQQKKARGGAPAWCEELNYSDQTVLRADSFGDPENPTAHDGTWLEAVCATRWEYPEEQAKVLAMVPRWMEQMGYDDRDLATLGAEAKYRGWARQTHEELGGALAQLAVGYGDGSMEKLEGLGARASMYARFAHLRNCYQIGGASFEDRPLLIKILCTREKLDLGKVRAEIDATAGINDGMRRELRWEVKRVWDIFTETRTWLDGRAKEEPGIAKLIAIAEAQFAEWAEPTAKRSSLMALAESLEQATVANKRSAFAGCETKVRAAWTGALAGHKLPKPPATSAGPRYADAVLGTADAYLAFHAMNLCSAGLNEKAETGARLVGSHNQRRGPRTATIAAWMAAAGEVTFDDRDLSMAKLLYDLPLTEGRRYEDLSSGIIDTIERKDGEVRISFQHVTAEFEECESTKPTNRVRSISSNGDVIYETICTRWVTVKRDDTAAPIRASEVTAGGLEPGMFLVASKAGLPIVATRNARSTKPIWLFGGAVK
jgi:hypothetical protein